MREKGNKKKAQAMLLEARQSFIIPDKGADGNQLFADYMLNWLHTMENQVAPTTFSSYSNSVERVIYPYFKSIGIRLNELKHYHLKEFYDSIFREGKKLTTVDKYHANIHLALKQAVKLEDVPSNQADFVDRPKKRKFQANFLEPPQCNMLYEAAKGTRYEMPVGFGVIYGLRRSELVGLKWKNIDFANDRIYIRHMVTEIEKDGSSKLIVQDTTKTESSNRILPLIPKVKQWLLNLYARQQENRELSGRSYCNDYLEYIYVDDLGNLIRPNFISSNFKAFAKRNGIENLRFHDLRHTCASLLLKSGVNLKAIQEYMGHSDFGTTFNLYAHLDYSDKIVAANALIRGLGMEEIIETPQMAAPAFDGFLSDITIVPDSLQEPPVLLIEASQSDGM